MKAATRRFLLSACSRVIAFTTMKSLNPDQVDKIRWECSRGHGEPNCHHDGVATGRLGLKTKPAISSIISDQFLKRTLDREERIT